MGIRVGGKEGEGRFWILLTFCFDLDGGWIDSSLCDNSTVSKLMSIALLHAQYIFKTKFVVMLSSVQKLKHAVFLSGELSFLKLFRKYEHWDSISLMRHAQK